MDFKQLLHTEMSKVDDSRASTQIAVVKRVVERCGLDIVREASFVLEIRNFSGEEQDDDGGTCSPMRNSIDISLSYREARDLFERLSRVLAGEKKVQGKKPPPV